MSSLAYLTQVPIDQVRSLGPKRVAALRKGGIASVADLLLSVPHRYVDRSKPFSLEAVFTGEEVTLIGTVHKGPTSRRPRRGLELIEAVIQDGDRRVTVVFFNQPWMMKTLHRTGEIAFSGKLEKYRGRLQMTNPAFEPFSGGGEAIHVARTVPIHPQFGEATQGHIRRAVYNALGRSKPILDVVPQNILERNELINREQAFRDIHFPPDLEATKPARKRLVFDEFFRLEVLLAMRRHRLTQEARGFAHETGGPLVETFKTGLPYTLTGAQERVMTEIEKDLSAPTPMHRLLEGEVGSGKTVVAVHGLLIAVQGGHQGAVMAPTEVLADQHFMSISNLLVEAGLAPTGEEGTLFAHSPESRVKVALLTSNQALSNYRYKTDRLQVIEDIAVGAVDIVIGTHALIQEGVHFRRLGLAVVDEQHRFGVGQRVQLREKGVEADPDLLIMTATPIPRTLAMTLYGDLEHSILDEMPAGRLPVKTRLIAPGEQNQAWSHIRREVLSGRQAFVVCPLVQDSEKIEAASAEAEFQRLAGPLEGLRLGLLHGQLPASDKETVMAAFRSHQIDVLVSTTVIEVGIDVPNATVMVIEDADRFGLSQLHQLRGRVGRGTYGGVCLLIADPTTAEAERRLAAMVATNDGFRLAEEDLAIRGQGMVFGARQSGMGDLRMANVVADYPILVTARKEAFDLVAADPELKNHPDLAEEVRVFFGEDAEWLDRS